MQHKWFALTPYSLLDKEYKLTILNRFGYGSSTYLHHADIAALSEFLKTWLAHQPTIKEGKVSQ